ncbi:hypothetical protein ACFX13_024410 [Malus domestica]
MALYLPLSAGAYFDKLQDQWLKLLLLQRFSCDLFSFRPCSCTHLKKVRTQSGRTASHHRGYDQGTAAESDRLSN